MSEPLVPIILGSKADLDHARAITSVLAAFGIPHEIRIASAHKATRYLLDLLPSMRRVDASSSTSPSRAAPTPSPAWWMPTSPHP